MIFTHGSVITGDGLIRVWYTMDGSFAFGSDSQTDVRLMTLRLVNGTYRIVSNGNAFTPLGTVE